MLAQVTVKQQNEICLLKGTMFELVKVIQILAEMEPGIVTLTLND